MAKYIDVEKVFCADCEDRDRCGSPDVFCDVHSMPAADVAPVVHGEWILGVVEPGYFTPGGNSPWVCSECGRVVSWMLDKPRENYCPNCGADMRERKGDE